MQAYEFYATPENGYIPIPERYKDRINKNVKVIVLEEKSFTGGADKTGLCLKSGLLLPPTMNTSGWSFNREEANER